MKIVKSSLYELPVYVTNAFNDTQQVFFCSLKWFINFTNTVVKSVNAEAFAFYEESIVSPIIFPVMIVNERSLKIIRSLSNYYSPIYSVINNNQTNRFLRGQNFFKKLKSLFPPWDLLELRPLSLEECTFLKKQLRIAGIPAFSYFCFGNWYLEVNGRSFNDYFFELPSKLKNTILRKSKKFFSIEGARIEIITNELGLLASGLEAYQSVYSSSWKVPEPFPGFIPGLIELAASIDGLRLGVAYLKDKPIAAQLWIVADNTAYIFKLAYDEGYKQYSVGTILTTKLMEYVLDVDKVEMVDYLCGDDEYKKEWMSNRRERWGIIAFNTSSVKGCFEFSKELLKYYLKLFLIFINPHKYFDFNQG